MKILSRSRMASGEWRITCQPELPSQAILDAAKMKTTENIKKKKLEAVCPLCLQNTAVTSDVVQIRNSGLCGQCNLYATKKNDYVFRYEDPSIEDVLNRWLFLPARPSLGRRDQMVAMAKLIELLEKEGGLPTSVIKKIKEYRECHAMD